MSKTKQTIHTIIEFGAATVRRVNRDEEGKGEGGTKCLWRGERVAQQGEKGYLRTQIS